MKSLTVVIVLAVYVLLMWALLFLAWRRGYREWHRSRSNRFYRVKARVMVKREVKNTDGEGESWARMLTFDMAGRQSEYAVPLDVYTNAHVGQMGLLHIRKQQFELFEPEIAADTHDDLYGRMVKG